jgi:hypothetical protein
LLLHQLRLKPSKQNPDAEPKKLRLFPVLYRNKLLLRPTSAEKSFSLSLTGKTAL